MKEVAGRLRGQEREIRRKQQCSSRQPFAQTAEYRQNKSLTGDREEGSLDMCPRLPRSSLTGKDQSYKALRPSTASLGLLLQRELCDRLPAQSMLVDLNLTAVECCKAKAFTRNEGHGRHFGDDYQVLSLLARFTDMEFSPWSHLMDTHWSQNLTIFHIGNQTLCHSLPPCPCISKSCLKIGCFWVQLPLVKTIGTVAIQNSVVMSCVHQKTIKLECRKPVTSGEVKMAAKLLPLHSNVLLSQTVPAKGDKCFLIIQPPKSLSKLVPS